MARDPHRVKPEKFSDQPCPRCGSPERVINPKWLRAVRLAAGLTLRAMATRSHVSVPYLCDIEHGRRNCLPKMAANYETFAGFLR